MRGRKQLNIHLEIYQFVMVILTILASAGTFTSYFYRRDERLSEKIDNGLKKAHEDIDQVKYELTDKQDSNSCNIQHGRLTNVLEKHDDRAQNILDALSKGNERLAKIETCLDFILKELKKA